MALIPLKLFFGISYKSLKLSLQQWINRRDSSPQLRPISVFGYGFDRVFTVETLCFLCSADIFIAIGYVIFLLFYFHEK